MKGSAKSGFLIRKEPRGRAHLEHTTSLLVDQARDTLDTTTTCETTNSGLGNTLDVVTKDFTVPNERIEGMRGKDDQNRVATTNTQKS